MRPRVSRNATRSSPSNRTRTGGQSGSGSSDASKAGIQYRRSVVPIGVPRSTRVSNAFSSRDSMAASSSSRDSADLKRASVRELDLLARDELEKHGPPAVVHLPGALESRNDLGRLLDPLGVAAHGPAHVGVMATDVARAIAVVRHDERVAFDRHGGVVEHDGGMGIPQRTAVSKSRPVMPNAASPMKFAQNLSGAATLAPMIKPSPVPSACDLPQPMYPRGVVAR